MHEISYGITSLNAQEANPERLLQIVRQHWGIENGLHYRPTTRCAKTAVGSKDKVHMRWR